MKKEKDGIIIPKMTANRRLKLSFVSGVLFAIIIGAMLFYVSPKTPEVSTSVQKESREEEPRETFSYKGREGVDALTLLIEQTNIEQDTAGLVVKIGDKKTDTNKREFWSFYVNGVMAQMGPKDYVTTDTDLIEWRIETY